MAYGNYGAFVYKNGVRMKAWEDQTPYQENVMEAGYWQAFVFLGEDSKGLRPHHAVLGEGDVRLCAYKDVPSLYVKGEKVNLVPFAEAAGIVPERGEYKGKPWASLPYADANPYEFEGEIAGYKFKVFSGENFVELSLICPNGDLWTGKSGFEYGAGWMD